MDVTCERCKAEYEFDDSLLGERGTTVKCSSCGHVFRVLPGERAPARPSLKLRHADGRVETIDSLRDLQRRVREGTAGLNDELGRDGFPFRKLSDVPELRSFFAPGSGSLPLPASNAPALATGSAGLAVSPSSMPAPPDDKAKRTILGLGPQTPQFPKPARMPDVNKALPPTGGTTPYEAKVTANPKPAANAAAPGAKPHSPATAPTIPSVRSLYLDENEAHPARATEGSSRVWWIAGAAALVVIGGFVGVSAMAGKSHDDAAALPGSETSPAEVTPAPSASPTQDPAQAAPEPAPTALAPEEAEPPVTPDEPTAPAKEPAQPSKAQRPSRTKPARAGSESAAQSDPASAAEPKDYGTWVARGEALLRTQKHAEARTAFEKALGLRPSGSEAATGMGNALVAEGKHAAALPHFERAARNGYVDANIGLGDALRKLGRRDDAVEAYNTYVQRLPNGARTAYARAQIDALEKGSSRPEQPAREPAPEAEEEPPQGTPSDYRPAGELVPSAGDDEAAP